MTTRLQMLDGLEMVWKDCQECPLSESRTRLVHWRGSSRAKLMIIGGGPGKTEDKEGRPLVGLAGRKLDEILKLHDINPGEDVFIANVVACHGKHDPTRVEMAACRSRLQALARIVEPRAILLLGLTAGGLAGVKQVEDWRGQPLSARIGVDEWPATVSWHPSQILDATFEDAIRLQHELALDVRVAWEMARE